jgi:hypothetical protein
VSIRDFLTVRRSERLKRKAHKAMIAAYGAAWERNSIGVTEMLTAPGQVVVLEGAMLEQVVRQTVNAALASSQEEFQPQEPAFQMSEVADTAALPPAEELPEQSFAEPPRDTSIFAPESVGNGTPLAQTVQPVQPAAPAVTADLKRQEFLRMFVSGERAARGLPI